jgi:hypothetical protein
MFCSAFFCYQYIMVKYDYVLIYPFILKNILLYSGIKGMLAKK